MADTLFFNRVNFRATAGGTGDFVVASAIIGYSTPAQRGVPDGTTISYTAESDDRTEWETGLGTYASGTVTVDRATVRESTNAGALVNFTFAPKVWFDFHAQELQTGTIVVSQPFTLTQTWNDGGVTFTGIKFGVTNTASAANSKLIDLQVGGTPMFFSNRLGETSATDFRNRLNNSFKLQSVQAGDFWLGNEDETIILYGFSGTLNTGSAMRIGWSSSTNPTAASADTGLGRNAAGIVEVNNGTLGTFRDLKARNYTGIGGTVTTSTPVLDLSQTWNAAGVTFTALKLDVTNTASTNGSKLLDMLVGGTTKFAVFRTNAGAANQSGILVQGADTDRTNIRIANTTSHNFDFFSTGSGNSSPGTFGIFDDTIGVTCLALSTTSAGLPSGASFGWSSTDFPPGSMDTLMFRDAAAVLALRNGTNAQTYRWYRTFTDASNYVRGALQTGADYIEVAAETAGTGADDLDVRLTPAGTGSVRPTARIVDEEVILADAANVTLNAALGNTFKLTAAGNRQIDAPTNKPASDLVQRIVIAHEASGGARTLTLQTGLAGGFRFGTDVTGLTATTSGLTDYIGCIYNDAADRWDVVSYSKGY